MGGTLKQYLWVLDLVAALLCSFFAAKVTSIYIAKLLEAKPGAMRMEPVPVMTTAVETSVSPADFKIIVDRNVFDSSEAPLPTEAEIAAGEESMTIPTGEAARTSLGIKVYSVLVMGGGTDDRSSATIQGVGAKSSIDTYAVGDENGFAPNTKLTKVQPDRIEFVNNGRLEYALLEDSIVGGNIFGPPVAVAGGPVAAAPAAPAAAGALVKPLGENKFVVDQSEIDNAMKNLDQLYTDIRAVPNFAGGKVSGMKILSVKAGSIFDKLGLKRGDVLERINGVELDVKQGFQIFSQLKDEKRFTLDLIRQGANQTMEYEIR